jgi:hypothetical protein
VCRGFVSPLKIHRLGPVLNPQTLGPVASTLTITPPRQPDEIQPENTLVKEYNASTNSDFKNYQQPNNLPTNK